MLTRQSTILLQRNLASHMAEFLFQKLKYIFKRIDFLQEKKTDILILKVFAQKLSSLLSLILGMLEKREV